MISYNYIQFGDLSLRQSVILRKFDLRAEPELCLTLARGDMDMDPRFLAGKEEEPIRAVAKDGWTQELRSYRQNLEPARPVGAIEPTGVGTVQAMLSQCMPRDRFGSSVWTTRWK